MSIFPSLGRRPHAAAWLVAAALLFTGPAASAESRLGDVAEKVGLGLAAATCTALYVPLKVFVASNGLLIGAGAWALTGGDSQPALEIVERTGGGDWIVTQQHLSGDRRFYVSAPRDADGIARRD